MEYVPQNNTLQTFSRATSYLLLGMLGLTLAVAFAGGMAAPSQDRPGGKMTSLPPFPASHSSSRLPHSLKQIPAVTA